MKKGISLLLAALMVTLTSCAQPAVLPIARDIANIQLMRTMALDEGERGAIKVTVSSGVRPGERGGSPQKPVILSEESETVFGATLRIQTYGEGYISLGHISQCILSTEAAGRGEELLDFIQRDFEMRASTELYLTDEGPAEELLTASASENSSAAQRLDSLYRDFGLESEGWPVTVKDFMADVEDNGCAMAPILKLEKNEEETTIVSQGMGWFSEGEYGGRLPPERSRSAAMLLGKLQSGVIELEREDGSSMGLRLTSVECDWIPQWQGERLTGLRARVQVAADLAEEQGRLDLFDIQTLRKTERSLSGEVKRELEELMRFLQEENMDLLHLRRMLAVKSPAGHARLEERWEEWFPTLAVEVEVTSQIQRSYDIGRPQKEEKR